MPYLKPPSLNLYYEESGEGEPLVLQSHEHRTWIFQQAYFSEYFRVITFDRRGTGRSANPPGPWTVDDFSEDLCKLLDALEVKKAIVVGHSLGGLIAEYFALNHPDRVRALILSSTQYYVSNELAKSYKETLEGKKSVADFLKNDTNNPFEEKSLPNTDPDFASSMVGRFLIGEVLKDVIGKGDAALKTLDASSKSDLRGRVEEFQKLHCPTLVLAAGNEQQDCIIQGYEVSKLIPNAEFRILSGVYHGAPRENPELWCGAVRSFLVRHDLWPR